MFSLPLLTHVVIVLILIITIIPTITSIIVIMFVVFVIAVVLTNTAAPWTLRILNAHTRSPSEPSQQG